MNEKISYHYLIHEYFDGYEKNILITCRYISNENAKKKNYHGL